MKIVGITGSLGMGKSTIGRILRMLGFPVFDADREVRDLLISDSEIIRVIISEFPNSVNEGVVDRAKLADEIYGHPLRLKALENILHPAVRLRCDLFLETQRKCGKKVVFIDIPLLYETGYDAISDVVWVAWCEPQLRYDRVKKRSNLSDERIEQIIETQLSDAVKKQRADWMIDTSGSRVDTARRVAEALRYLCSKRIGDDA